MGNPEQTIDELHQVLIDDWDAAQDWGEDPFTQMMTEEVTPDLEAQRRKTFEATCYYAVQQLMYGEVGKEIIENLIAARGDIGVPKVN